MKDIMKIVRFFEKSGVLMKGYNKTFKNKRRQQKNGLRSRFLGTINPILLRTL